LSGQVFVDCFLFQGVLFAKMSRKFIYDYLRNPVEAKALNNIDRSSQTVYCV